MSYRTKEFLRQHIRPLAQSGQISVKKETKNKKAKLLYRTVSLHPWKPLLPHRLILQGFGESAQSQMLLQH